MLRNYKRQSSNISIVLDTVYCGSRIDFVHAKSYNYARGGWVLFNALPKFKTKLVTLLSKSDRKYLTKHKNSIAQDTKTGRSGCSLPMEIVEPNI